MCMSEETRQGRSDRIAVMQLPDADAGGLRVLHNNTNINCALLTHCDTVSRT